MLIIFITLFFEHQKYSLMTEVDTPNVKMTFYMYKRFSIIMTTFDPTGFGCICDHRPVSYVSVVSAPSEASSSCH